MHGMRFKSQKTKQKLQMRYNQHGSSTFRLRSVIVTFLLILIASQSMLYTVKIICKRLPYLGATELHPIWVNFNPDIFVPG